MGAGAHKFFPSLLLRSPGFFRLGTYFRMPPDRARLAFVMYPYFFRVDAVVLLSAVRLGHRRTHWDVCRRLGVPLVFVYPCTNRTRVLLSHHHSFFNGHQARVSASASFPRKLFPTSVTWINAVRHCSWAQFSLACALEYLLFTLTTSIENRGAHCACLGSIFASRRASV